MTFQAAGNTFKGEGKVFTDSACQVLNSIDKKAGTFSIGTPTESVEGVTPIDWTIQDSNGNFIKNTFDIYKVEDGILYFGTKQGATAASRPTMLMRKLGFKLL